jgi:hypothetical protein
VADNPHITALLALLDPLAAPVYVTRAPADAPDTYVVLHPPLGLEMSTSFAGDDAQRFCRFMTHSIGSGWEQAAATAGHVRDALSMVRPVVTGRKSTRIEREMGADGIDRDEDMPDTVYIARAMWYFTTWPS